MTDVSMDVPNQTFAQEGDIRKVSLNVLSCESCSKEQLDIWRSRTIDDWRKIVTRAQAQTIRAEVPESIRRECFKRGGAHEVCNWLEGVGVPASAQPLAILDDESLIRLERVL